MRQAENYCQKDPATAAAVAVMPVFFKVGGLSNTKLPRLKMTPKKLCCFAENAHFKFDIEGFVNFKGKIS